MDLIKWQLNFGLCNFGLKSYLGIQIKWASSILKSRAWFRTKLHSTQLNYHYISRVKKKFLIKYSDNIMIYNGNWTEWSAIWSEIIRVISKLNERVARVRFEITSMISDQNCMTRSSIPTLLDPFRNHTIFGEKQQSFGNSSCKILHTMTFCLSFSWNLIDYFNSILKSDWLFCFTVPFSLAEKKIQFRAKNGVIRE